MRGVKGSGKSILVNLFLNEHSGLLWNSNSFNGSGFRTMVGPNSITEAGMFGSVGEEGEIVGRPIARELCGGFLGFEEFSSLTAAAKKDHSTDMTNQLLTSTDNGRVDKGMKAGWVKYTTRYSIWAGTQPARFEMESGMDRRFFIIDIEMNPKKELAFKQAQIKQGKMTIEQRRHLREKAVAIRRFFQERLEESVLMPPLQIEFTDEVDEWLLQRDVRSFEADLFRRLMIGYHMMQPTFEAFPSLIVSMDGRLKTILDNALRMRRNVMDADLNLIKETFWLRDLPKSTLVKEIARMITMGDYQSAKRWIEETLVEQTWYKEYKPPKEGRGRKGMMCRIGWEEPTLREKESLDWGEVYQQ
ncbi:MAG: hypothetical protein HOC79_01820 [Euryarchaeota archaeon]|nr:hypothetical protein [Euryarchaeota archaeon]